MAQETRAELYAKILANLPDNTTEAITPATDRAVENAEVESCFNLLDDEATDVNYNPTNTPDWLPEGAPSEVGEGLDILAARTGVNLSQDIAYVSSSGNNTGITPELGNPLKPFATFGVAKNAVPVGGTVKALGGSYDLNNETVFPGAFVINKSITLDITGCDISGRLFYSSDDITIIARGATITNNGTNPLFGFTSGGHSNCKLIGGTFDAVNGDCLSISSSESSITFIDATFKSNKTSSNDINNIGCIDGRFVNCKFISSGSGSITIKSSSGDSTFINCEIIGTSQGINIGNSKIRVYSSKVLSDSFGIVGTNTTGATFDIICENSYIKGGTDKGLVLGKIIDNIRFTNCTITGGTDAVSFTDALRTTANNNNIFEKCSLYAGTGDIFAGTYDAADLGNSQVTNCIYNKAYVAVTEVVENNITTIIDIQNVEF